jgi:hypothetical protein
MFDMVWILIVLVIPGLIVGLGVWVIRQKLKERKLGIPSQDERTRKVMGKASTYALFIGLYFMLGLFWILFIGDIYFEMPDPGAMPVLLLTILVMGITHLVLQWYFNRKGDV